VSADSGTGTPRPAFKDHFSGHAAGYARSRPGYPEGLFDFLASIAPRREAAWDCGTGSGQSAVPLAKRFARVIATDASAAQVLGARRAPGVLYAAAAAERAPLRSAAADLITVSQALHWFDFTAFFAEAARVARPGAALAAWAYGNCRVCPAVDALYDRLYGEILGPFWPPERVHIEQGYRTIPVPFPALPAPAFSMRAEWDLNAFLAYLDTWSSAQRYRRKLGKDPLDSLRPDFAAAWGIPEQARIVEWPLILIASRIKP
jgi:SAM-dependent methyltransferase